MVLMLLIRVVADMTEDLYTILITQK